MEQSYSFTHIEEAAERLAKEEEKLRQTLEEALEKADEQKRKIQGFFDDLKALVEMVRAYFNKEYTAVPWKTIVFSMVAILYFLNPLDIVPDLLPGIGFIDDATLVAFIVTGIREDLEKFKQSREQPLFAEEL
ncbi:MAG: DUF1232 domain-containing protein [Calditrichia bacterium]